MNLPNNTEAEKKLICCCYSCRNLFQGLTSESFYNIKLGKIYSHFMENGFECLNTEEDYKRYDLDMNLFFECLETDCFTKSQGEVLASEIIELSERRNQIKNKYDEISSLSNVQDVKISSDTNLLENFFSEFQDIADGKFKALRTPWTRLEEDSLFTEGKSITILVGSPGAGKSFFLCQLFGGFVTTGVKACMWAAENNRNFHARRTIAQYVGDSNYCDNDFLMNNAESVRRVYEKHKTFIEDVLNMIYSTDHLDREALLRYCHEKVHAGYEVIGIDPLSCFDSKKSIYEADVELMKELNKLVRHNNTRFIIATHPRESGPTAITEDNIAGGRSLSRFAHNIIWLNRNEDGSRTAYTLKTRSGRRVHGGKIDMMVDPESARFYENY